MADERPPTDPIWNAVEAAIFATLTRITAPESEAVSLRRTAGLLTETIASIANQHLEALEKYDREYKEGRWVPQSEITDEQVLAFQLAYDAGAAYEGVVQADRVRAGLVAVHRPAREIQVATEMREVIATEPREGDTITMTGKLSTWGKRHVQGAVYVENTPYGDVIIGETEWTATRPVAALPDKPGAVVRCHVDDLSDSVQWVAVLSENGQQWRVCGVEKAYHPDSLTLLQVIDGQGGK